MKIVVIIPTYNEKENISALLPVLEDKFKDIDHDMHVLVVDDESPDGTAEKVREIQKKQKDIYLITGKKKGLGAAYIRGMTYAIEELNADAVMEMDADFSHKPEDVKRLVAEFDKGFDFIIGSRYVPGGSIPNNWTFMRRMNSKWGNIFARYVAGLYNVHDCTAGFRAIRTDLLKKIDLKHLRVKGYSFQMNLLRAAVDHGARVKEVPVDFIDRTVGESKLQLSDQLEFIFAAWIIRFEKSETFLKFLIVGASGVIVNLGTFNVLLRAGINEYIASALAIEMSIISNFLLNNYWTFAARKDDTHLGIRGLKFNLVSFVALGVSYTTFVIIRRTLPDLSPTLAQAIGILPATAVNYFLNTYFTWKGKSK